MSSKTRTTPKSGDRVNLATLDRVTVSGIVRQSNTRDGSASLDEQEAMIRAECERRGWHLAAVYVEQDVSGRRSLAKRPGLQAALEDIERGRSQVLATAYFDRFVRSLKTQHEVVERVERAGGHVFALDVGAVSQDTASQWLTSSMLGMVAEYYSRSVGERLAAGKAANVARGVPPFPRITPAYVRRADGTLEPHPVFGPLVAEACKLRAAGASFAKVQAFLVDGGLALTQRGVISMLGSRLLVGEIHFGDLVNLHAIDSPICDRATFRAMHKPRVAQRGRHAKSPQLLARLGVLVCGGCGARMSVHSAGKKGGTTYPYYRCGDRECKARAIVAAKVADDAVRDEVLRLGEAVNGRATSDVDVEVARIAAADAEARLAKAIRTLVGLDDENASKEVLDELKAERDAAHAEHARLAAFAADEVTLTTGQAWSVATLDERRRAIVDVVAKAVVAPGRGTDRVVVVGRTVGGVTLGE